MERLVEKQECGELFCKYDSYKCIDQEEDGGCQYCEHFSNMLKKLHTYEEAEEQGMLLLLPLKLGDKVYSTVHFQDITEFEVNRVTYVHSAGELYLEYDAKTMRDGRKYAISITGHMLGKTVFLTKAEAEKALAEMEESKV